MPEFDDLEEELRALGDELEAPVASRDMAQAVRDQIEPGGGRGFATGEPRRRRPVSRPAWRWAVAILVVTGVLLGGTPQGRAAVTSVLRFAGIELEVGRPEASPSASASPVITAPGERSVTLADARRAAGFPVRVPAALGDPDEVRLREGVVTMLWGSVRLDQFDGRIEPDPAYYKKLGVAPVEVTVDGRKGLWVAEDHPLIYRRGDSERTDFTRRSGPTLIWRIDGITLRLEGIDSRKRAISTAASS